MTSLPSTVPPVPLSVKTIQPFSQLEAVQSVLLLLAHTLTGTLRLIASERANFRAVTSRLVWLDSLLSCTTPR